MKNIKEAFGTNLHKIRKSKKITIEALAEASNISSRLLSNIEAGDTFVSAETLCKICVALDVEPQILFDFDWFDKYMYYDNGKYIKPQFRAIMKNNMYELKSLPTLKGIKINNKLPLGEVINFLMNFSKTNNLTIYADYFIGKERDKIVRYTPDGAYNFIFASSELKEKDLNAKGKKYYDVIEKIRDFSTDKKKIEYINIAIHALKNKNYRDKLRIMLDAIDISE